MAAMRDRRGTFGEATGPYESGRVGYSEPLVEGVLAYAALEAGAPVLEAGAGTGKATVPFAARGLALTCVEPDPRMARVLRRNISAYPQVSVVESPLEDYTGLHRGFGLLIAAQSWHWIHAEERLNLAVRALRPGGVLALLWNSHILPAGRLRDDLRALHDVYDLAAPGQHTLRDPFPEDDDVWASTPSGRELAADTRFADLDFRIYQATHPFTTGRYLDLLLSLSSYRVLPQERRSALLAEVRSIVDGHGGSFTMQTSELIQLARVL